MLLEAAKKVCPGVTRVALKQSLGPGPYSLDVLSERSAARQPQVGLR